MKDRNPEIGLIGDIMAGRKTVYNNITSPEKLAQVNPDNIELGNDFVEYLQSIDRSPRTIAQYKSDLDIFWCWNLEVNKNKFFVDLSKREVAKFQSHALNTWQWSPSRIRRVKSTLSSLSNFIENMLDDEYEGYRPIVRKIESPANVKVRDKTIFTDEQLQDLLDYLVYEKQYDKACMLSMAMNNGRRKSELPRVKVSYFTDKDIRFGSLYKSPEQITTKGRGSRGKMLTVWTLAKPFQPYLDLWLNYRKENNITSEWLIPKCDNGVYVNEQIPVSTLDSWADTFTTILGEPFYWHSLRHYFTTACAKSGLPDDVIRMLVGWEDNSMVTLYKDLDEEDLFSKYFNEDGIQKVETKTLNDL